MSSGGTIGHEALLEALRRSEERLKLALDATGDGLFEFNLKTGAVDGNPALFAMLGYAPGELAHVSDWERITHVEDVARVRGAIRAHVKGETPMYAAEVRLRARDGSWRWILDRGRVVERDDKGHAVRMTGLHTDISSRKMLEAQLHASGRLASIGTLAAGLAHEINTPLTYLSTGLDTLARQLPALLATAPAHAAANALESLDVARDGARRVQQTVRDMKLFARPGEEALGPVDVRTVIAQAVRLCRQEIARRARLVEIFEDVPLVNAHAQRLGQVFLNLLVNAAQAIEEGRADRNEVRVTARRAPDGDALVEIRDTGCGISSEIAAQIFDPFFTTKPVGVGTGLGLWICHQLLEPIGGRISFESEPGKGTCFRVTLPAATAASIEAGSASSHPTRRGRLLVVDDHAGVGVSLRLFLANEHDVVSVTSAAAAVQQVESGDSFDLVLCDVMMPDGDGRDVYRRVLERAPSIADRFVFMTGGAYTPEMQRFLRSVKSPVLEKPFQPEQVRQLLQARVCTTSCARTPLKA